MTFQDTVEGLIYSRDRSIGSPPQRGIGALEGTLMRRADQRGAELGLGVPRWGPSNRGVALARDFVRLLGVDVFES
jgi:hypothetical protein